MVRLKKTKVVEGKKHETFFYLNENEWRVLQKHMSVLGNDTIEVIDEDGNPTALDEIEPDDKPKLEEYEVIRIKGEKHFKAEEYEKALYYFEKAYAIRDSYWLKGRVNKCKSILNPKKDDKSSKPKRRGRPPRK